MIEQRHRRRRSGGKNFGVEPPGFGELALLVQLQRLCQRRRHIGRFGRWQWDSPLIISPHEGRRLYFGGERVYRSNDRGDSWTAVSGDLTRQLDATKIPIMGKVWPPDSVAFNQATTTLSTITALPPKIAAM